MQIEHATKALSEGSYAHAKLIERQAPCPIKTTKVSRIAVEVLLVVLMVAIAATGCFALVPPETLFFNQPMHSFAEIVGACLALLAAAIVLAEQDLSHRRPEYLLILGGWGLMAMGVIQLAHAALSTGSAFVWSSELAMLLGGLFFSMSCLPVQFIQKQDVKTISKLTLSASFVIATGLIMFSSQLPATADSAGNLIYVDMIHLLSGLLFLFAAVRFALLSKATQHPDYLVFSAFCLLMGISGCLFTQGWEAQWWLWKGVKIVGFLVVFLWLSSGYRATVALLSQHLADIVSSSADAIISQNIEGEIVSWNKAAEPIFGFKEEEVLGKNISLIVPEDLRQQRQQLVERVMHGERISNFDTQRSTKDGRRIDIAVTLSPIHDERGAIIGVSAIERDITEVIAQRRNLEQSIEKLHDELEAKVLERTKELEAAYKDLEAFSFSVSHDLRTPLRALIGFSRILVDDYGSKLDDEGRDYLHRIESAAKRMSGMIDGLLRLSRIGRTPIKRETINLSSLAEEIKDELGQTDESREVELVVEADIVTQGDHNLIRIALQNLVSNAWKFTSPLKRARIEIGTIQQDDNTIYFVKDNGVGFDVTLADKLFSPFQRLHSQVEFPGDGIGLAVTKRIIQRHGGKIWFEGTPGEGASFYFTLRENKLPDQQGNDSVIDSVIEEVSNITGNVLLAETTQAKRSLKGNNESPI